ncbi:deleted in azoospermia protein 1-like [Xenia sp. Carnegie-2017]|uniref:deleted in azoospermia protein 1-like n=1 Tax=Xenia sp. Carnegie-2017 TaxID=2897299 RepID=UPI001F034E8C|nr:deleted in azoospermia protein 1-like [Xenia sp. Carnegie-2017]
MLSDFVLKRCVTSAVELAEFFRVFGHVTETKIILDHSGLSKGYGFVTFESKSSVKAIENIGVIYFLVFKIYYWRQNTYIPQTDPINWNCYPYANQQVPNASNIPAEAHTPRMAEIQTYLYGKKFPNRIFVGRLPLNTSAVELAVFFRVFGHVTETKIILDHSGLSKGYGFVTFESKSSVKAIENIGAIYFLVFKIYYWRQNTYIPQQTQCCMGYSPPITGM